MLKIRHAQLQAMAAHDVEQFSAQLVALLLRKHADRLAQVPADYVARLAGLALSSCIANGFDSQGLVVQFAEALVKDDAHPMDPAALDASAHTVLREFRSRTTYLRLQAGAASATGPTQE